STNADVPGRVLRTVRRLDSAALRPLNKALAYGVLCRRGVDRCLRLAWTVADLAGAESPGQDHGAEALVLRGGDAGPGTSRAVPQRCARPTRSRWRSRTRAPASRRGA